MSDDWKTVPTEPTHEMRVAGREAWRKAEAEARAAGYTNIMRTHVSDAIYKAMLDAAPPVEPDTQPMQQPQCGGKIIGL